MICRLLFAGVALIALDTSSARGEAKRYEVRPNPDGEPAIRFRLPYSLGTHEGEAKELTGFATFSPESPEATRGVFHLPISSLHSDDAKRDCHMREALGLDYSRSEFPKEHVCDSTDRLPESGKNAVAFPDIKLEVTAAVLLPESRIEVDGRWTIHGVTRPVRIPLLLSLDGKAYRLRGSFPISLSAYKIAVKPAKVLFFKISVEDEATVSLDLRLEPSKER